MFKRENQKLTLLVNIGPVTAKKLKQLGIASIDDFLARDPYEIFFELLNKIDPTLCRCALASIVGASKGLVWHTITHQTAKEFERRYPKHKWGRC